MTRGGSLRSEYALACGSYRDPRVHGRAGNLLCVHGDGRMGDGLRAGKGTLRNHHHRTLYISVRVRHVRYGRAFIDDGGVVDVRDHGGIDRRVADVNLGHVAPADLVGGT